LSAEVADLIVSISNLSAESSSGGEIFSPEFSSTLSSEFSDDDRSLSFQLSPPHEIAVAATNTKNIFFIASDLVIHAWQKSYADQTAVLMLVIKGAAAYMIKVIGLHHKPA
jgi:hypothetical protein